MCVVYLYVCDICTCVICVMYGMCMCVLSVFQIHELHRPKRGAQELGVVSYVFAINSLQA